MEYYFAFKKKEILQWATTWMNLEDIMLSEVTQSQKDKSCSKIVQFIESESGMAVAWGWGQGEMGSY